jgi:DNA primase
MVPIINLQNRTLGFGARVIDQSLPKYINTSETKVFKKNKFSLMKKF